jgi:hypothetical protein
MTNVFPIISATPIIGLFKKDRITTSRRINNATIISPNEAVYLRNLINLLLILLIILRSILKLIKG